MFIGHFGVAFAAKRVAPSVSLGVLFAASELADLIWPNLVLLGIEKVDVRPGITVVTPLDFVSYPYSHSLAALCAWAVAAAAVYVMLRRSTAPRSRAGAIGLWSLVAFLLITYLGALFGPPPPSATAVAWSAEAVWLLAAWAAWSDGARSVHGEQRSESRRVYQ